MSEEENIAIETLKEVASDEFDTLGDDISPKMAQNILNLIEKQQKEIEELKEMKPLQDLIDTNIIIADYSHNYISKDKIRDKIATLEKEIEEKQEHGLDFTLIHEHEIDTYAIIQVLKELLEEN